MTPFEIKVVPAVLPPPGQLLLLPSVPAPTTEMCRVRVAGGGTVLDESVTCAMKFVALPTSEGATVPVIRPVL